MLNKCFLIILLTLTVSCTKESYVWFNGSFSDALSEISNDQGKILFLDFYSDNWGACVRLDAETLSNNEVISFSKENFLSLKLKPWSKRKHSELFDTMKGKGLPLLVYLNNNGEEIDRILGYLPPYEYLKRIKNIVSGNNTFLSLKNKFNGGSRNINVLSLLAQKCDSYKESEICDQVYSYIYNNKLKFNSEVIFKSEIIFGKKQLEDSADTSYLMSLKENYSDPDKQKTIYTTLINYYQNNGDSTKESDIYKKYSDIFLSDINILNAYAWRMTEIQSNLEDALDKSIIAIKLSSDDLEKKANILDTKAEILWLLNRYDEAIITINLAIEINPESDYFKAQLTKFQNSKNQE